ncbi:FKBP-type peptidyl-prolyl cis-trans isomerase [Pseudolysinimonas yzui]|uniref:peptidylprolyl isomerase n=1 Tax=Pseudolysinimonas yzui TaxID=2708254 RepID=A0A8J3LYU0_9MICO|nr:FKBP-type peptidyl-prolyl cis-trans isomerase [Pseudolysinimonas yzui]GHF07434.1 peptidylprolyl isomerase [Pseudolysinimonas yzui]
MPIRPGLAALAIAALVLVGCAARPLTLGPPSPTPTDDSACASPGEASDAVVVSGDLGNSPVIAADGPFSVDRVERTVLIEGSGDPVAPGDLVEVAITIVNATTGEQAPGTASARVLLDEGAVQPGLLATILCATPGSRIVGVVPAAEAFGSAGQPELAIGPDDDLVFVVDVLALVPLQADGVAVALPDGFPELGLEFDADGRPTVTIPAGDPPGTLLSATLLEGTGAVVGADDEFLVQFQGVNWRTGDVFDETWGDAPRSLVDLLPGVDAALVGRAVGSRVVVIVPPADGFGSAGSPSSGIAGTDTVVYVVDILATTPPAA